MVLDPTAGSFSSGRACLELGRSYIGIEKDEKFYNENKIEKIEMDFQHSAEYNDSNNKQE
jgi:DNA modification methylase